jgi:type II secretory pathway component GspD/PulD (secretin)
MNRFLLSGVLLALLAGALAHAQQTVLEVVPLRYRTAAEVIPILQPMLAREGSLSGYQGQLVVRTTPANLEEIKRVLAGLDTAPRQLVITVRQDAEAGRSASAAEVSGSVGGDHGRVTVPGGREPRGGGSVVLRDGDDSVRLNVREGSGSQVDRNTQSVRVLEGREAFVRIGQSVPVRERQVQRSVVGGRVVEQTVETTQFREAADGIYVLPRVAGDRVTLDISAQRESLSGRAHGGTNVQSLVTTVSGRLGEWIEIGGVSRDASAQQSVLLGRAATTARDSRRVLIKVEEAR